MSDLALFDPSSFTMSYLNKWMHFLLQLLKKDREKSVTFLAIGKIATAIESNITPFIDPIFANIKEGLSVKRCVYLNVAEANLLKQKRLSSPVYKCCLNHLEKV